MLLAAVLAVAPTTFPPPVDARGSSAPPNRRGIGMMVGAGVLGVGWIGMTAVPTATDPSTARRADREGPLLCIESCYAGPRFHGIGAPILVGSMALLGSGMHRLGRYHRVRDANAGATGGSRRKSRVVLGTGVALLGGGAVTLVVSQLLGHVAPLPSELARVSVREAGWWTAGTLGLAGAALTGYAHGRIRAERGRVEVAPSVGRDSAGVSLRGTF